MFRKIVLLFVFLVLAAPAFAISLDFNESTVGKEKQLSGNILLIFFYRQILIIKIQK
ncbi:hypothetical protein HYT56_04850 [Candidatus Woesearchaeota archaeon]|nr:hypothetical protein [Candidatus Woesearchaeota archaeon]